VKIVAY